MLWFIDVVLIIIIIFTCGIRSIRCLHAARDKNILIRTDRGRLGGEGLKGADKEINHSEVYWNEHGRE